MGNHGFLSGQDVTTDLETRAVNTIRMLAADAVQQAKSGHPGMPMGMAQAAYTLWTQYLRFNPHNPEWANRDRFVLSAGHGSMLLYALLYLTGYGLSLDDLRAFRQWGSRTPGHPEAGHTPGVETTTGPLGQGFANGVGMAIAERWLAARFNKPDFPIVDHYTYAIVSDGDLMEGVASEAASLAGHLRLGKLIYLYDDNNITIDGKTEVSFTEDVAKRFDAYGWHVEHVDGLDAAGLAAAIEKAQGDPRPSLIAVRTVIGYGAPNKAGTSGVHGAALGEDELLATRQYFNWNDERFYVPGDVGQLFGQAVAHGAELQAGYDTLFAAYAEAHPQEAAEYERMMAGDLPDGWEEAIPVFPAGKAVATRNASGKVLNAIAPVLPNLIGGSADLAESNKTTIEGAPFVAADSFAGPNIHFGVREHGMGGILNGMALHGGVIPYGGTFLVFSDYMRGSIRLAALTGIRVIYVFTHDSIGLGEDGPTHQPIEHLAALRAMPNMTVMRPADANETAVAWRLALENTGGPTVLALTRQDLATPERSGLHTGSGIGTLDGATKGGYIYYETSATAPQIVLVATGSEVEIAYQAAKLLEQGGVQARVVSLLSWEIFGAQSEAYRASVLPAGVPKVAVEAASPFGWERWVGNDKSKSAIVAIDHFGASAPYKRIYQEFGLTPENVADRARTLLQA